MSSVELRNKTQKTVFDGTEWVYIQNSSDPYLVQKISLSDLRGAAGNVVGSTIKTESKLIPISPTHPWFCLSYPSIDFTTANYSTEFIDALRARKYIYDEFSTNTSEFSGTWSSNVFTLTDNAANNAMLAELAEDWLYHGSPVTNWRILNDGITDFNITGINVTSRTITVNLDEVPATGTSIIIYTNRVYRNATQARHFSEAGLATYQAGGGKSGSLFRRDQGQGHYHRAYTRNDAYSAAPVASDSTLAEVTLAKDWAMIANGTTAWELIDDGTNGTPRTGTETIAKSSSRYEYIYVGSYTV